MYLDTDEEDLLFPMKASQIAIKRHETEGPTERPRLTAPGVPIPPADEKGDEVGASDGEEGGKAPGSKHGGAEGGDVLPKDTPTPQMRGTVTVGAEAMNALTREKSDNRPWRSMFA